MQVNGVFPFRLLPILSTRNSSSPILSTVIKGIGLQRISLIPEESGWRDKHFAANFMKIGGSVS